MSSLHHCYGSLTLCLIQGCSSVYYDDETRWPHGFTPSEEAIKFEGGSIWPGWSVLGIFGRDSEGEMVTVFKGEKVGEWMLVRGENRKNWLDVILRRDERTGLFLLYESGASDKNVMLNIAVVLAFATSTALLFHDYQKEVNKKEMLNITAVLASLKRIT